LRLRVAQDYLTYLGSNSRQSSVNLDGGADHQPTQLIGFLEKKMRALQKQAKQTKNFVRPPNCRAGFF
jgi:hypothetical protein